MNYYNEHDPNAAAWLEELVAGGDLPPGFVDSRDVQDIGLTEPLDCYNQCHFFAGIGGWSHALDLAGWPRDRAIWSASLPCQPFSDAGKSLGVDDERHLWPTFHRLVKQYRPVCIVGEQVASKAGRAWFSSVQADLEALGYRCGAVDICAAGIGAPHIRQRLYWCALRVGDTDGSRQQGYGRTPDRPAEGKQSVGAGFDGGVGHAERIPARRNPGAGAGTEGEAQLRAECDAVGSSGDTGGLVQPDGAGREPGRATSPAARHERPAEPAGDPSRNPWGNVIAVPCADGKSRLLESCLEPLADGFPARLVRGCDPGAPPDQGDEETETPVTGWPTPNTSEGCLTSRSGNRKDELLVGGIARSMPDPGPQVAFPPLVTQQTDDLNDTNEARTMRLKGYGNAIVAPLAAEFISAFMEILEDKKNSSEQC